MSEYTEYSSAFANFRLRAPNYDSFFAKSYLAYSDNSRTSVTYSQALRLTDDKSKDYTLALEVTYQHSVGIIRVAVMIDEQLPVTEELGCGGWCNLFLLR